MKINTKEEDNSLPFEKEEVWVCEEGWHNARCKRIDRSRDDENKVRLVFSLLDEQSDVYDYVAGKHFENSLKSRTELRKFLFSSFGEGVGRFLNENSRFDIDKLVGEEVCLCIQQKHSTEHAKPFCNVIDFAPRGSITCDS